MIDSRILFSQAKSLRTLRDRVLFLLVAFTGKPAKTILSWSHQEAKAAVNVTGFEYRNHLVRMLDSLQGSRTHREPAFPSRKGHKAIGRVQAWRLLSFPVKALRRLGIDLEKGVFRALRVFNVQALVDDLDSFLSSISVLPTKESLGSLPDLGVNSGKLG
jgi:hypothetical protein